MNKLRKHGVYYDSRIKLLLILLTSALAFALGGGLTGLLLFGVVCLFALLSGLWKTSIKVAIVYIVLLTFRNMLLNAPIGQNLWKRKQPTEMCEETNRTFEQIVRFW